jgi:hypothetical protein
MGLEWLDRTVYPFRSRYLDLVIGRMHYVDLVQQTVGNVERAAVWHKTAFDVRSKITLQRVNPSAG